MKTRILWKWGLALSLAVFPYLGRGQGATNSALPSLGSGSPGMAASNAPSPAQAEIDLENAPVQVVSPAMPPTNSLSAPALEIVKLAQAGVDESVMMAYVTNSANVFNLGSDDIVYLNDIGVSSPVITAMIQRDQSVRAAGPGEMAAINPGYTNQLVPAPGAPTPYDQPVNTALPPESQDAVQYVEPTEQPNVTYEYFYNSLSPYGAWVNVDGYGLCWQPTVAVIDTSWQPYGDRGRWLYSDYGWYWASDYSWGWAPFHYGRWFHHSRRGWCWAPDTVWGPSWVSWRYTPDYCGWAPLPPTACYRPGFGFTYYGSSVGASFSFGLTARHYAFVPVRDFCDRYPYRHRVPDRTVSQLYNNTVPVHQYEHDNHNRIINRGIPVEHVRSVTRTDIQPVQIHRTDRLMNRTRGESQSGRTVTVFNPNLPQPQSQTRLVGEGVPPARNFTRGGTTSTRNPFIAPGTTSPRRLNTPQSGSSERGHQSPMVRPDRPQTTRPSGTHEPNTTRPNEPLILRGPSRSGSGGSSGNQSSPWSVPSRGQVNPGHERVAPPTVIPPTPPTPPTPPIPPTPPTRTFPSHSAPPTRAPSRQSYSAPAPVQPSQPWAPAQTYSVQPQAPRVIQRETPSYTPPPRSVTPTPPVQRQQVVPSYQPPQIREQPRSFQRSAPMPQMETRQAPNMSSSRVQVPQPAPPVASGQREMPQRRSR